MSKYQIAARLYESNYSIVYRGYRSHDNRPVILKCLKDIYPKPERIASFKREYEITRNLKLGGVVEAYALESDRQDLTMILEDFGGDSLSILGVAGKLPLIDFLELAIEITKIIGQIHGLQVIHKDINPSNIVWNTQAKQVKIIDFGISNVISRENTAFLNPNLLEGTLPYISPEQTGRMNRAIDYRSDLYSLGITFYELLAGQLPFEGGDALEWVHNHIAKPPISLLEKQPNLPKIVSAIVMKLIAKNAEDRYQSTRGLQADLERCLHQTQSQEKIDFFQIGSQDSWEKFTLPQKLYGREAEIEELITEFDRASQDRSRLLLVSGYSGTGKTALVREIYKPITARKGIFISGKFDQYQRQVPYYAFSQAFNDFCQQLLAESEAKLAEWRQKILAAVGNNGRVLIDLIPNLELAIGKQPPIAEVGGQEMQNRFNLVLQSFLQAICQPEHPLVIFIDDLQWADTGSLTFLTNILSNPEIKHLLLIGAYRSNEVDATHPLAIALTEIEKSEGRLPRINVNNLILKDVNNLITDALKCEDSTTHYLAELIYQKTEGNAFFVSEFLKSLDSDRLLYFDRNLGKWQCHIEAIEARGISDNVVELLANKIINLDSSTQTALQLAACIGNRFNLSTLAIIHQRQPKDTWLAILPALTSGAIVSLNNNYKLIETGDEVLASQVSFKFQHDRVQQAAYSLIEEDRKQLVHERIGRLLLHNTPASKIESNIFSIVNHLNLGVECADKERGDIELGRLNLLAGKKAKAANAYKTALSYFDRAIQFLPSDSWDSHYLLTLEIYTQNVEAAYLNIDFESAEKLSAIALQQAQTLLEKAKIYETKIRFLIAQNQMQVAIDTGMEVLELLGISLSESPPKIDSIEDLYKLPLLEAPDKLAAQRILVILHAPAYIANPEILVKLVFTTVSLCIDYGNSPYSAFAYAYYGLLLCGVFSNIELGYQFGQLAEWILTQLDCREIKCKAEVLIGACIKHWREPLANGNKLLRQAIATGIETGDLEYASTAVGTWFANITLSGEVLDSIYNQQLPYLKFLQNIKQDFYINYSKIWMQFIQNLQKKTSNPKILVGEMFAEAEMLLIQDTNNFTSLFAAYLAKTILSYLFKDYRQAIANAERAANYAQSATGLTISSQLPFYYSLSSLALCSEVDKAVQNQYLERVDIWHQQIQNWAEYAPMNFQHKSDLIAAEKARVSGQIVEAMQFYELAIKGARNNGYLHEEAIAYELAAEFYLNREMEEIAQTYLSKAYHGYLTWGAINKTKDLEARYPQFFRLNSSLQEGLSCVIHSAGTDTYKALDFGSIFKASQVLSSEIVLENLLEKIVQIAMENAGADKGWLLLKQGAEWTVRCAENTDCESVVIAENSNYPLLPMSAINYVTRTQKSLILPDNTLEGAFDRDPYLISHQPKSILCTPLLDRGEVNGVLYLENNLTVGAFTSDRLEVLKLLSTQAAISLENAQLYDRLKDYSYTLEQKVAERTSELEKANQELQRLVQIDGLTQIANRRRFDEHLAQEWQRALRERRPLSMILCDVDYFKHYNDRYGHPQGDICLQQVAKAIDSSTHRPADLAARYGGEEFAVILPNTPNKGAESVAKAIQTRVRELQLPHAASAVSECVTLSMGVATIIPKEGVSAEDLVSAADRSLYEAKKRGRDRFVSL